MGLFMFITQKPTPWSVSVCLALFGLLLILSIATFLLRPKSEDSELKAIAVSRLCLPGLLCRRGQATDAVATSGLREVSGFLELLAEETQTQMRGLLQRLSDTSYASRRSSLKDLNAWAEEIYKWMPCKAGPELLSAFARDWPWGGVRDSLERHIREAENLCVEFYSHVVEPLNRAFAQNNSSALPGICRSCEDLCERVALLRQEARHLQQSCFGLAAQQHEEIGADPYCKTNVWSPGD